MSVPASVEHHGFQIPRHLAWRTGRRDQFREVSDNHIALLRTYARLDQAMHVVEIGCGVGRDAIPLRALLPKEGSYLGIDVMRPSIEWAAANIISDTPRFEFVHFDVADAQHNPGGQSEMTGHVITREDSSVDLVFLYSVFTHMFPRDVSHYLREFSRVLRPGGRVLAPVFTMDRSLIPHLEAIGGGGLRKLTFAHEVEPGFFHNDPEVVPGATAYSLDRLSALLRDTDLSPERFVRGTWRRDGTGDIEGQDLVILSKRAF